MDVPFRARLAGLVLPAILTASCARAPDVPAAKPNILLVTIDTFRADRLGVGVTPALDRLAASGVRFTSARTAVPLTLPSHTSILTGLLPPAHGVRVNGTDVLGDAHPTIARLLKGAGYDTAAFVGAFVLDRRFGLANGFDTYDDRIARDPNATDRLEAERPANEVVERALAWLDHRRLAPGPQPPAPFLLWIHLYDPHAPYTPPDRFRERVKTPYDGEIAFADEQIARVFDWLRAHRLDDHTMIVVAGDHGEGLGDHGERTHGMLLYDSTLRVPLVVSAPGLTAGTRADAVSLIDIAPTILRAAGVTPPAEMKGQDLVRLKPDTTGTNTTGTNTSSVRLQPDLYSETNYPLAAGWSALQALTDGRWMTIRAGAATEVYDVQSDPAETHDVAAAQAGVAAAMSARAGAIHASGGASGGAAISADARERLRSLGYVASSAQPSSGSRAPNPAARIAVWNDFEAALTLLNARRPAEALTRLRKLAAENPDAPTIAMTYARALKEAGQLDAALAAYRDAGKRWPTDALLLHDLAVTAREAAGHASGAAAAARLDEAARADQAAATVAPDSAQAINGLGLLAIDGGRAAEAVRAFERATTLDPNNASYWTNLGNAKRAVGDAAGAEQAYRGAFALDASAGDAANGLGVLLVEAHKFAEAAPWFERALAASPDLVEARLNLGIALQQSGDTARAIESYRGVLAARGSHPREKQAAAALLASLRERR
jgi:choline-sulfatase